MSGLRKLDSSAGLRALDAVLRRRPLFAFDFDGTLAPIVAHPDEARVPDELARRLARLARLAPVAIVTGRSIEDVKPRLGIVPTEIVGSHGAEDAHRGIVDDAAGAAALDALRERLAAAQAQLQQAGVTLEDKQHSLALHYRRAADHAAAQRCIAALLEALDPALKTFGGKCVVNVVAAGAPDKGDAVLALVQRHGAGSAVFIGDDLNDEAVFERAPRHWLTLRVGCDPAVPSAARYCLTAQSDVVTWVDRVLAQLDGPAA
jgi:trehalose 6-phosphate phosphatase